MAKLSRKIEAEKKAKKKNNLVKIHNDFVYSFIKKNQLISLKIIFYMAKHLEDYPKDKEIVTIKLDVNKLLDFCKIHRKTLIQSLVVLQKTSISFTDENKKSYVSLIPKIIDVYNKEIVIQMFPEVLEKIINLKNKYTTIDIEHLPKINNKHTLRLLMMLENISRYDNNTLPKKYFDLEELNLHFGTNYKRGAFFRMKILEPAKEELDKFSKLSFTYDEKFDKVIEGKGRARIVGFTIYPVNNKNPQPTLF